MGHTNILGTLTLLHLQILRLDFRQCFVPGTLSSRNTVSLNMEKARNPLVSINDQVWCVIKKKSLL